jgi:hypothetical protein
MSEISRFYGIVISMYHGDHNPPHFHAHYGEYYIEVSMRDMAILSGHLPPRALSLVIEWASMHKPELLKEWNLTCEDKPLFRIKPLR